MVRRAYRQRSLVEVLLPDADRLWDPTLRRIDEVLDDEVLVDRVAAALAQRHPQSQRRGRLGTPADVVLRMLVLKHLHDWSFDECAREVRGSLVYRAFCRIDGERVPDAKTLIRLAHLLDEPVLKDLLAQWRAGGRTGSSPGGACALIRPSSKPTFTTRRTPRCWRTGCVSSPGRCDGSANRFASAPVPSAAGSLRELWACGDGRQPEHQGPVSDQRPVSDERRTRRRRGAAGAGEGGQDRCSSWRDRNTLTKEMLYLAVSAAHSCSYCIHSHTTSARKAGMTEAMLGELLAVVGMASETNALAESYQIPVDERFKV
jgi:AhpD family alkylhydroperoxidase